MEPQYLSPEERIEARKRFALAGTETKDAECPCGPCTCMRALNTIDRMESDLAELLEVATEAETHARELADAWQRGALSEHDGKGGTRSNRNHDLLVRLAEVVSRLKGRKT